MRLVIAFVALLVTTPAFAQTSGSSSGASAAINITNPASTTATNRVITPPTMVAPGLAAVGVETCLGSSSGGVSVMGGGFSFGRTTVDDGCSIRLLARQLYAFGLQKAAMALMCQDERVAIAMDAVGTPCPSAFAETAAPARVTAAARPFTREEQAWFDRASN
jgi:hypothetical protein